MTINNKMEIGEIDREGNNDTSLSLKKRPIQGLYYCFTKFNYEKCYDIFIKNLKLLCKKYIFGFEICPTTNKSHLQGWFELKKKMRITELIHLECHLTQSKGSEIENINYCSKDKNTVSFGYPKPIKQITNLRPWQLEIESVTKTEPDGRTIYWYYDTIGGIGKSSFCKYMYLTYGTLIIQGGKLADIVNIIFNSNMDYIETVIIDIPRNTGNKVSYNAIECILNGMITNTKYETGIKCFNPPHILVFSNFMPNTDNMSLDRWKITDLTPENLVV